MEIKTLFILHSPFIVSSRPRTSIITLIVVTKSTFLGLVKCIVGISWLFQFEDGNNASCKTTHLDNFLFLLIINYFDKINVIRIV